jgi:hypothetical protein
MTIAFEILRGFGVKGQAGFVEAVRTCGKHTQSGSVISTKPEEVREADDRGRVERSRGSKSFHDDAGNSPDKPLQKHPTSVENKDLKLKLFAIGDEIDRRAREKALQKSS